jgi:type II secretory ATPase GspE/PulE/Tfp pilus assembly ATPase PilB-like protein
MSLRCPILTRFVLVLLTLLLAAPAAFAESTFPRGPGNYLNLATVLLVVLTFLGWVYACWWVDDDARRVGLDRTLWNGLVFGGGLLGLLAFWLFPWFFITFPLLLALIAVPLVCYVVTRNGRVPERQKVWTVHHAKLLIQRHLGVDMGVRVEPAAPAGTPKVRFLPLAGEAGGEDAARLRRAGRLPGHPHAGELLAAAVCSRASEIQLEPTRDRFTVFFRIDGVFHSEEVLPRARGEALLQVFKLLAELDLAEKRKPQENTFPAEIDGRRYEVRVRSAGTVAGERLLVRLYDRHRKTLRLDQLGLPDTISEQLSEVLGRQGLLVLCGPAGAGRTTTAYACLHALGRWGKRILTVEDQIDHRLANADQVQLNRRVGETFAGTLRHALLRENADVLYLDEIRDGEAAELACQKAKEGRLVIAVLEAPDALTGLFRLVEWGVPPARLARVLLGVLAQRLVRVLCPACKIKYRPNPELVRKANLDPERIKHFYRPPEENEQPRDEAGQVVACERCDGLGYRGRTGVFEWLCVTERIQELLQDNAPLSAIKQEAVRGGTVFLQDEAMRLVIEGTTSIPEMIQALK